MSLAYTVLKFVRRARTVPVDATDPRVLSALEGAAQKSFDGAWVAMSAPIAPLTWEIATTLISTQLEGPRIRLDLPRPMEVVGFFPSIVVTGRNPLLTNPTLTDLLVSIDANEEERITSGQGITTNVGGSAGTFVTLAAISSQSTAPGANRLIGWKLDQPKPNLGFTFRWKVGANFFNDALINVSTFVRYIEGSRC